jgi:transcriptional regulator with XRE-family HTH domain
MLGFEQLRQQIGANIRIQRKNVRCTQQELAEKLGKSRFWLTAIETGSNLPTLEGLYQLVEIFDCSICDLLPLRANKKSISVTGPADLINNSPVTEQIFSMLDGVKNGKI